MIDDKLKQQAERDFIRARLYLLSHRPFYAHLVLRLKLEWLEDCPGGLSCTDGESLFIAPDAFTKLTKLQQVTTLVHETLHCAAGHLWRRGAREPQKWNLAADVAIDNIIHADRFEAGPWEASREACLAKHGLSLDQFNGQTAEAVYEKLPDSPKQPQCGCGGSGGCFKDKSGDSSADRSAQEADWKAAVIAAGQLAGKTPGAWQELVKAAMPKPPFHLKLFEYLNRGLGGDTDWAHLSRRTMWRGLYLPTDTKVVMGEVAYIIDTSGSMDSETQLKLALGYCRAFRDTHPHRAHFMTHDCGEPTYKAYEEHEPFPDTFQIAGRGGTKFNRPFELMREKRIEPRVCIYMTDAYGSCTTAKPPYPVLWVIVHGDKTWNPPWGEVCRVT